MNSKTTTPVIGTTDTAQAVEDAAFGAAVDALTEAIRVATNPGQAARGLRVALELVIEHSRAAGQ